MYKKSEMRKMTNEELNVIAMKKNSKKLPTSEARYAQEFIWERRMERLIHVRESFEDEYEGWRDPYDE